MRNSKSFSDGASLLIHAPGWLVGVAALCLATRGYPAEFTGPAAWHTVNTNVCQKWQERQQQDVGAKCLWRGVAADTARGEVRLYAEAVGHGTGVTAEFLLVGPRSDRAYESAAVAAATPGDIVRAVEALGIKRGGAVGSRPFRFWPCGERFSATVRRLDLPESAPFPLQRLVADSQPEAPILGGEGLVFTGGRWKGQTCLTDSEMPAAIISLYNAVDTIFDVPVQAGQGEVYGRLSLAEALPYGTPLEIVFKPLLPPDGKPRILPLTIRTVPEGDTLRLTCTDGADAVLKQGGLDEVLAWLRDQGKNGREPFVTLALDDSLTLKSAVDVARVFDMLDGKGLKLDGKTADGLYPRAFLPREKWRERAGRHPQPFELHLTRGADGVTRKKLVFVEEDWEVEGLEPKLTPREYPFAEWPELPLLISRTGGNDSKVNLLFVFTPLESRLGDFMPGIRAVGQRLPLVYIFSE